MAPFSEDLLLFLQDDKFIDWVMDPNSIYDEYWREFLRQHPERMDTVEQAKSLIRQLYQAEFSDFAPAKRPVVDAIWNRIAQDTVESGSANPGSKLASPFYAAPITPAARTATPMIRRPRYWIAAAAVLLITGSVVYVSRNRQASGSSDAISATTNFRKDIERVNHSKAYKLVYLPDGSKVTLSANSTLTYDKLLTGNSREVFLSGEAFFDIAPSASKPFYVYTGKLVTKVLGTSFRISSLPASGKIVVAVRSGKVSVYPTGTDAGKGQGLILLPRQRCIYVDSTRKFITDSVKKEWLALAARPHEEKRLLNFEDAPISKVFDALEERFAVHIEYDRKAFADTYITVDVEEEAFGDKLAIICKTINANYKIENYHVLIEATNNK